MEITLRSLVLASLVCAASFARAGFTSVAYLDGSYDATQPLQNGTVYFVTNSIEITGAYDGKSGLAVAPGALIVLSMQGFGERWHPGEKQERLCAAGRMLYLSPYEPQGAKLDKREMHIRAHALVDWALGHSHDHLEAWP